MDVRFGKFGAIDKYTFTGNPKEESNVSRYHDLETRQNVAQRLVEDERKAGEEADYFSARWYDAARTLNPSQKDKEIQGRGIRTGSVVSDEEVFMVTGDDAKAVKVCRAIQKSVDAQAPVDLALLKPLKIDCPNTEHQPSVEFDPRPALETVLRETSGRTMLHEFLRFAFEHLGSNHVTLTTSGTDIRDNSFIK